MVWPKWMEDVKLERDKWLKQKDLNIVSWGPSKHTTVCCQVVNQKQFSVESCMVHVQKCTNSRKKERETKCSDGGVVMRLKSESWSSWCKRVPNVFHKNETYSHQESWFLLLITVVLWARRGIWKQGWDHICCWWKYQWFCFRDEIWCFSKNFFTSDRLWYL